MSNDRNIAANLAQQAAQLVATVRGQQHGDAVESFTMIAELWSVWINHAIKEATGIPPTPPIHLTAFDALQMMSMVKKSRSVYGDQGNSEHYVDDIGYTSLAGMSKMRVNPKPAAEPEPEPESDPTADPVAEPIPTFLLKSRNRK
jgi:hypothetical protein